MKLEANFVVAKPTGSYGKENAVADEMGEEKTGEPTGKRLNDA